MSNGHRSHPSERQILVIGLVAFASLWCTACHSDYQPPWPPDLNADVYKGPAATSSEDSIRIGGARLAKGGVYVDLVCDVHATADDATQTLGNVGRHLSLLNSPEDVIEIRDASGQVISLERMREPDRPSPLSSVSWRRPPTYVLDTDDGQVSAIQVCMWRTGVQLEPGIYKMCLTGWPTSQMQATVDTSWKEVRITWPE